MPGHNALKQRRKLVSLSVAFDGGRLHSDSGVMQLSQAQRCRGIGKTLAALIADPRDPAHVTHKWRMCCGPASSPLPAIPTVTISAGWIRSCFQARLRAGARNGRRFVFAAHHLALGERDVGSILEVSETATNCGLTHAVIGHNAATLDLL